MLVRYKRTNGDQAIPSGVAALRTQRHKTKHCASPLCSPNNSDNKEEEEVNDKEGGGDGTTTGLVSGHDESVDKSDIKNI